MSPRIFLVVHLVLLASTASRLPAQLAPDPGTTPGEQRPAQEASTTDSTLRSAAASGISGFHDSLDLELPGTTSKWLETFRAADAAPERAVRMPDARPYKEVQQMSKNAQRRAFVQIREETKVIAATQKFAGKFHTELLGNVASAADLAGTGFGYLAEGDGRGAIVAVIDDVAEGMYAAGGAVLAGAMVGSAIGPVGTIGGAVTGLAGAAVGSLGYNLFISPDVTAFASEVLGEPTGRDFFNQAVANKLEHTLNSPSPLDEYLVNQLTERLRAADALAAEQAADPPEPILATPPGEAKPPVDAQGRKLCPYCHTYH